MNPHIPFHTAIYGDPLDALDAIREVRALLKEAEHNHVLTLRKHGAPWTLIARHLHISRQAVHKTYSPWEPPTPT